MSSSIQVERMARAAANWFADQLAEGPTPQNLGKLNWQQKHGLRSALQERCVTPEQIERFRQELLARLLPELDGKTMVQLQVDYDPLGIVADAAQAAGLPLDEGGAFPWKIDMQIWLAPPCIKVSVGSQPQKTLAF